MPENVFPHTSPTHHSRHQCWMYISEVGGVSPTGKSFRVVPCVRACVRAVWMPSENQIKFPVGPLPFSLLAAGGLPFSLLWREVFPFPLWDLVSPGEIDVKSKWSRSGIKVKSMWNQVKSKWNRREIKWNQSGIKWNRSKIEVKSKWNQSEIKVKSTWNHSGIKVKSKWNHSDTKVKPKWNQSEIKVKSKWNQS